MGGEQEKATLDEDDTVWLKFKNMHIVETLLNLSNEISNFAADNQKTKQIKKGENVDIEEAMEVIRNMPKYKELMKKYTLHLQLCQETVERFTKNKWRELISLEQSIITGVDDAGREVSNMDIIRGITKISKDISREDHTRLLLQYLTCYELSEKDRNMITSIQDDTFEQILENLPYVFPEFEQGKKLQRRIEKISDIEFSNYRKKLDKSNYDILRSVPKLTKLAIDSFNGEFDSEHFDFAGDAPEEAKKAKKQKYGKKANRDNADVLSNPRIILFVIGGLSHHEIVSLHQAQEEGLLQCHVIAGGTSILRPLEMLEYLKDIHKFDVHTSPLVKRKQKAAEGEGLKKAKFEEEKDMNSSINGD